MFTVRDIVLYRGGWGRQAPQVCRITGEGIEAGEVVYDNSLDHWGYAYQYQHASPEQIAEFEKGEAA